MTEKRDEAETDTIPEGVLALDQQLCFAVYSAAHALNRTYKPLLDPYGLTYPQYIALMTLWQQDGRTVKALGATLGLDSGTLSPLLKRLEVPVNSPVGGRGSVAAPLNEKPNRETEVTQHPPASTARSAMLNTGIWSMARKSTT